ncbi:MAG: hypothetical protein EZS28_046586, partial [Streblomastix strix]
MGRKLNNYEAAYSSIIGQGVIRRKSLQVAIKRHNNNQDIIGKGRFLKFRAYIELDVEEAVRRELNFKHRIKLAVILKPIKQQINSSKYIDRSKRGLTETWHFNFLKRHPEFKRDHSKIVGSKRYHASTKSNIRPWVQRVQKQNPAVQRSCQKANIDVITFQSRTTHICQLCDCGVFIAFKKAVRENFEFSDDESAKSWRAVICELLPTSIQRATAVFTAISRFKSS